MTFNEAFKFTNTIPGSFTERNCRALYENASLCRGVMVEVGVDQGRSASIILAAAQPGASVILVDSWVNFTGNIGDIGSLSRMLDTYPDVPVTIYHKKSMDALPLVENGFNLIHIDADHSEGGGIDLDCQYWLPKLRSGGIALFHDYESCFPDVNKHVNIACTGWEDLGVYEGLAVRRKP